MKAVVVQHEIRWNELEWNLQQISSLMDRQTGADLYVLSETFGTGFLAEGSSSQADVQSGRILSWMREQAHRLDAAIAGSVVTADEKGFMRNRLYFVRPDGTFDHYDKRHLFSFAGESDEYVAGERRVVTQWRGVRFLLQVCYDLRFPVFSRNRGDYDAISFRMIVGKEHYDSKPNEDGSWNRYIDNIRWLDEISILSQTPAYSETNVDLRSLEDAEKEYEERSKEEEAKAKEDLLLKLDNTMKEIEELAKFE